MNDVIHSIVYNLDIAGILLLLIALIPTKKLIHELPPGLLKARWKVLSVMIFFFIGSYIYITLHHRIVNTVFNIDAVLILLFFGALFVFLVSALSLQTALDVKRIYRLEIESTTDPIMGIGNRRYLERKLHEEFSKARRYDLPLSVFMLDIDHFKDVNDTYGHDAGDLVLKNLGALISTFIRESDYVARFGGEEIVIIAPLTDGEHAVFIAERLRKSIEKHAMVPADPEKGVPEIRVTVSIGITVYTPEIASAEDLLKSADTAMYRAKNEGRNRTFLCSDTVSENVATPKMCEYAGVS